VCDFTFSTLSTRLIDAVRINKTVEVKHNGKPYLLKRRYTGRGWIIRVGNVFLRLSNSKILMFPNVRDWQAWEVHCFTLLHHAECLAVNNSAILCEKFPGTSLKRLLEQDLLTEHIVQDAGREFARAHALHSSLVGGQWSHGDPHLDNVLYDVSSERAFLIDFETRHWHYLDAISRHADDLLVFLLDLVGRTRSGNWQQLCRAFLASYSNKEPKHALARRLRMPHGLELVLWKTRTDNLPTRQIRIRLAELINLVEESTRGN
jgi:hypothetical protein